jgi:hypothetical protein
MSTSAKAILTAAIVGGVCGIAGAAFYFWWRAEHRSADERASGLVKQLSSLANRIEHTLGPTPHSAGSLALEA